MTRSLWPLDDNHPLVNIRYSHKQKSQENDMRCIEKMIGQFNKEKLLPSREYENRLTQLIGIYYEINLLILIQSIMLDTRDTKIKFILHLLLRR